MQSLKEDRPTKHDTSSFPNIIHDSATDTSMNPEIWHQRPWCTRASRCGGWGLSSQSISITVFLACTEVSSRRLAVEMALGSTPN